MKDLIDKLEKVLENSGWVDSDRHGNTLNKIWDIKEEMKHAIQIKKATRLDL